MKVFNIDHKKVGELFMQFVRKVKSQICGIGEDFKWTGISLEVEYDASDPKNQEQLALDGWNAMATNWAAVESDGNYTATITSLVERLFDKSFPQMQRKIRILSLGTGPGLYEIFLAWCLKKSGVPAKVISTDYSPQMVELQRKILSSDLTIEKTKVSSLGGIVRSMVMDMTDMSEIEDGSIDIIICNNSLQWVGDWKKAVMEMGRVMRPDGQKLALFFIHPHAMKWRVGEVTVKREHVELDFLLDTLNTAGFDPVLSRMLVGRPGTGQQGAPLNRMMLETRFRPEGVKTSWRNLTQRPGAVRPMNIPKA